MYKSDFQGVLPSPILKESESVLTPISPRKRIGFLFSQFIKVSLLS